MQVIAVNGSPRAEGNTARLLKVMLSELEQAGIKTSLMHVGAHAFKGCLACGYCATSANNLCAVKTDPLNDLALELRAADGFILGSPTYYGGIAGGMKCFLDRLFFTSGAYFKYKVTAAVASVRRSGGVGVVHQLHNYLLLSQTLIAPSRYWTAAHGLTPGEILQDAEGLQTAKDHARAMAWLLKLKENGTGKVPLPADEAKIMTNFIR